MQVGHALALANLPYVRWQALSGGAITTSNLESTMASGTDVLHWAVPGSTGAGVQIAVNDTGIGPHDDFAGRVVDQYDYINSDTIADDEDGHGTHVAGTAAGSGAGRTDWAWQGHAPGADLLIYKLCCNVNGKGFFEFDFRNSLLRAGMFGVDVVNNSFGGVVTAGVMYNG